MDEHDQIYGDDRARRLRELLRAIAARIVELDAEGRREHVLGFEQAIRAVI